MAVEQIYLYPPILDSHTDAFNRYGSLLINFTVPDYNNVADIGHIEVRITKQITDEEIFSNNFLVSNGAVEYQGVYYQNYNQDNYVSIIKSWEADVYYKIQMRFGASKLPTSLTASSFEYWREEQVNSRLLSEWSTVMVTKAITPPTLGIIGSNAAETGYTRIDNVNYTFYGYYDNSNTNERLDKYKFQIINLSNDKVVADSGWIQNDNSDNTTYANGNKASITYQPQYMLIENNPYKLTLEGYTNNLYYLQAEAFNFIVQQTVSPYSFELELKAVDDSYKALEDGCIEIYLSSKNGAVLNGTFVLSRVSEKTNFSIVEPMRFVVFEREEISNVNIFNDYTIESGIKYKYFIQFEDVNEKRSVPIYDSGAETLSEAPERYVNLEYTYLYRDGIQLKLKYDNTMNTFKHTQLATKQDSIGGVYPTIFKNGYADYAEFPINGLISLMSDENNSFFKYVENEGYYYKNELVISDSLNAQSRRQNTPTGTSTAPVVLNTNLTHLNIAMEKVFREKVREFLQDNDYKLFRSPTEGNIIVGLINVSFSPNKTLGRMIASVSATAYELMRLTHGNLVSSGILNLDKISVTKKSDDGSDTNQVYFAQTRGLMTTSGSRANIYNQIVEDSKFTSSSGQTEQLKNLLSIEIEWYPEYDYESEIVAKIAQLENEEDSAAQKAIKDEIAELLKISYFYDADNGSNLITKYMSYTDEDEASLKINRTPSLTNAVYIKFNNGTTIQIPKDRKYTITDEEFLSTVNDISIALTPTVGAEEEGEYYDVPLLISYLYTTEEINEETDSINKVSFPTIIDQLAGTFTNGTKANAEGTNYSSLSILDEIYNKIYQDELEYEDLSDSETLEIYIDKYRNIKIEADEGTVLLLSENKDGSNPQTVIIGATELYNLNMENSNIKYIAFKEPTFAIVDFICEVRKVITNQGG